MTSTFSCGPLRVTIEGAASSVAAVAETLSLYDLEWEGPARSVVIDVAVSEDPAPAAAGGYLRCGRMTVDATGSSLRATTLSGAEAVGGPTDGGDCWRFSIPVAEGGRHPEDVEDLVGLALTTGWRQSGWLPVHAAAVAREGRATLLCAPSGGGKTTLTASLVRRGWEVLGDDKLLVSRDEGTPLVLAALLHTFNLDPAVARWLPEVGDLRRLPTYSAWTDKRKVRVSDVWPGATAVTATPDTVVRLQRREGPPVVVNPLAPDEVFETLLRQVALPTDRATARGDLRALARLAGGLRGLDVTLGPGAYEDPDALGPLEAALA